MADNKLLMTEADSKQYIVVKIGNFPFILLFSDYLKKFFFLKNLN